MSEPDYDFIPYSSAPCLVVAIAFTVGFGVSTVIHVYQCIRDYRGIELGFKKKDVKPFSRAFCECGFLSGV